VWLLGSTATFIIIRAGPQDPVLAILGAQSGTEAYHDVAVSLGVEKQVGGEYVPVPLWEQYLDFMWGLITLNFGQSWVVSSGQDISTVIATRAPATVWLGFWAVVIALFIGIPLGFYAGLNPNTYGDYTASFLGIVWRAMPNFWLAVILLALLSNSQNLFGFSWQGFFVDTPVVLAGGALQLDYLSNPSMFLTAPRSTGKMFLRDFKMILPAALVLGSASMGNEARIGRTAVLETINSNYVEMARAKGLPNRVIVWKHIFRNALIPLVPIITGEAFLLIGGSVVIEKVFIINGIGRLYFNSAVQGDLPLVGTLTVFFIVLVLILNIVQDILYTLIDPRVGYEQT
jgi:peptide/nickel transport system permease protein